MLLAGLPVDRRTQNVRIGHNGYGYHMRRSLALFALLFLLPANGRALEPKIEPVFTPELAGLLHVPQTAGPHLGVVLLHDVTGPDRRADIYIDTLLSNGFLVLEVQSPVADADAAAAAARWLGQHPAVRPGRVALFGFGAGGLAAAMSDAPVAARALLYPGCAAIATAALASEVAAPSLLLVGDQDRANPAADCARAVSQLRAQGAEVRLEEFHGVGFGWDFHLFGPERRVLLQMPGQAGRVEAAPSPAMTERAAIVSVLFLQAAMRAERR